MKKSNSFSLNREDLKSAGRGLVIALLGALITYLQSVQIDFGEYTALVVAVNSILVNIIRLYIQNNQK
jgi:hypothetical protein